MQAAVFDLVSLSTHWQQESLPALQKVCSSRILARMTPLQLHMLMQQSSTPPPQCQLDVISGACSSSASWDQRLLIHGAVYFQQCT